MKRTQKSGQATKNSKQTLQSPARRTNVEPDPEGDRIQQRKIVIDGLNPAASLNAVADVVSRFGVVKELSIESDPTRTRAYAEVLEIDAPTDWGDIHHGQLVLEFDRTPAVKRLSTKGRDTKASTKSNSSSTGKPTRRKLHIDNIDDATCVYDLAFHFQNLVDVKAVRLDKCDSGNSAQIYLDANETNAGIAIRKTDNTQLNGRRIAVCEMDPEEKE